MYKRTILTEKELQEEAARIMNSENDDSLSDILEPDEIPEMFLDSGSSYKPSSESGSSVEQNPVSDSEHTSDEAVSDLDENVPEMDSAPVNNQDDSDWLEIDDEPEVFDFSEIERLKIDISKECTPKDIFELLNELDLIPSMNLPFREEQLPYVFVADSAFALTESMLKPYSGLHAKGTK
uniref:Uncharacterized protein LOC114343262 n=1 Tax=Diabrotica virgifera virgifera TaxID=50390 RepID=A0A6P7GWT7_DIAVI